MKNLKASEEFVSGKHNIYYVNSRFTEEFKDTQFEQRPVPTYQKLARSMKDVEIEYELKPGYCSLGDILAFIENASSECKNGYSNLFYFPQFVVSVHWSGDEWSVSAWNRGYGGWYDSHRVFSPATGTIDTKSSNLESSDTLPLVLEINGFTYKRV